MSGAKESGGDERGGERADESYIPNPINPINLWTLPGAKESGGGQRGGERENLHTEAPKLCSQSEQ